MRLTSGSRLESSIPLAARSLIQSALAVAGVTAGLLLIFDLDQASGSAPLQHLYYLPIVFAAIRFGFRGGVMASLAAIVLYHVSEPRLLVFGHEHWDLVQVALFIGVGLITAKLTDDRHRLHRLATTDDLTGLHNLRSFEDRLATIVRASRTAKSSLALLVLDVDLLKSLNDAYGHLAGAEAVRTVGHIIAAQVPDDAVACRYGGDEFVIALPRCTSAGARAVADQLRDAVYATAPVLAGVRFPARTLSISVGVASRAFNSRTDPRSDAELGEELFRAADGALYQAKERGRNHVCVAA
jgi:diguanylate cyclase (GGDEF)-like protein